MFMFLQIRRRLEHNHWRLFNLLVRLQYDESPPWAHYITRYLVLNFGDVESLARRTW